VPRPPRKPPIELLEHYARATWRGADLAASVGLPTPEFAGPAVETVIDVLSRLAVQRHGATAVVRALSRAERAPATIAAI
jgi:hypothetical protein